MKELKEKLCSLHELFCVRFQEENTTGIGVMT